MTDLMALLKKDTSIWRENKDKKQMLITKNNKNEIATGKQF
jgi:hypothetical protein